MGDVFFDLANLSHHHRFNDEQVRLLLGEYFGNVTERDFARLKLMWPMSELREAMWGTAQTGLSKLDEDFQGYADLWFGRVREHLTDPRWDQWLKDVIRHVRHVRPGFSLSWARYRASRSNTHHTERRQRP